MIYTRSQLLSDINSEIKGKIAMIPNQGDFINSVAREVSNEIALRSTKRKTALNPGLFPQIFQYAAPSDLRDSRIIDIPAQAKRYDGSFGLVPIEQFSVAPQAGDIALDDYNGVRVLMINSSAPNKEQFISELDSITSGGGTWVVQGDAQNLEADGDDFIKGGGSLSFDIGTGGTTSAGIENSGLDSFDITDFLDGQGALFVWHRINSATNISAYVLRIGSSTGNYYTKTITTRHDGNSFQAGWNLLRFSLTSLTETGTVDDENINFISLRMTKTAGKISETDYKFDWLTIMRGTIHDMLYYSKYPWQNSSGTYLENSTSNSDYINADTSEYDLFVKKGKIKGLQQTNAPVGEIADAKSEYTEASFRYGQENPDESQIMVSTYHTY